MSVWDVTPLPGDPFCVTGFVSIPPSLRALERAAERLGQTCDISQVNPLPAHDGDSHPFGLIVAPERPLFSDREGREQTDAIRFGESLRLLRNNETHTLVQVQNGYTGWVRKTDYRAIDESQWLDWIGCDRVLFTESFERDGVFIPSGSEMPVTPENRVLLPTGSSLNLENVNASVSLSTANHQRDILRQTAESLLGIPYLWGGATETGIDCSGFTRSVYKHIGFNLPRDADQQSLTGTICALPNRTQSMRAGDLLFFTGKHGGITHVGMAMDEGRFVHADTHRGVTLDSLNTNQELKDRFLMAKRLLL